MRIPSLFLLTFLILDCLQTPALAVDRLWATPAGGLFNSTINWSSNVVPAGADNALFNLNVGTATYTVTFNAPPTHAGLLVRNDSLTLNLSGITYTLNSATTSFSLADQANNLSKLTIQNGTISATTGSIGSAAGANGNATITTGGALNWSGSGTIGGSGAGFVNIFSGGRFTTNGPVITGASATGAGSITINGAGSSWVASGAAPIFGNDGAGTVVVSAAGTFSIPGIVLGASTSGSGTVNINSAGSVGTLTAASTIGGQGDGELFIINGGVLNGTSIVMGESATGIGTVIVTNSGSWNNSGAIIIGQAGAGSVTISGASRAACSSIVLGNLAGSQGFFSTFGVNSSMTSTGSLVVGAAGTGTVILSSSGSLTTNGTFVGLATDSDGVVTVAGGAAWNNNNAFMTVGNNGRGTVSVTGGGTASVGQLSIGANPSGNGTVSVSGANSSISSIFSFSVGGSGTGSLLISSTGSASSAGASIGGSATGSGSVSIDGTGSNWNVGNGSFLIGNVGRGNLSITNGGAVSSNGAAIASALGSAGAVLVSGSSAAWSSSGTIFVGGSNANPGGSGALTVGPGGNLSVGSAASLFVWGPGVVNLNGGTIAAGFIQNNNGGAINFNSGTLIATGTGGFNVGNGGPLGRTVRLASAQTIVASQNINLAGEGVLAMQGGLAVATTLVNGGEVIFQDPTSEISVINFSNNGLLHGNGRIIDGRLTNNAAGELRADVGDRIVFPTASIFQPHANAGQINLFGGAVEFAGSFQNSASGRITGRGTFIARGGLTLNGGTMSLSGGSSDVVGNVTNNAGAKIIVTGGSTSTFFDSVTNNPGSEFRVSTASTAVFLGPVTGIGQFTGPGTKDFEDGTAAFGALDTTGTTIVGPGASLLASHVRENALLIEGRATIAPNGTAAGTSNVRSLTIEGGASPIGTLDLDDNALVVNHDGASPIATLAAQIAFADHGGAWDRPGITSALADATTHGVGIAERSALASVPAIFGTVDPDAVLIRLTRYGDANLDGVVNLTDFNALALNFGTTGKLWYQGDFTYDGAVDLMDFNRLAANFGLGALATDPTPQDWARLAATVPEPAFITISIATAFAVPRRPRCGSSAIDRNID
jgi:T5SS/PEP-CTERM-associated repeat protein